MRKGTETFNETLGKALSIVIPPLTIPTDNNMSVKEFTFQVCNDCQLRCSYCYEICKEKKYMSFDTAKAAVDFLFDNRFNKDFPFNQYETPGIVLSFIGGEPLLCINLIYDICYYFESKLNDTPDCPWRDCHMYSFSTNGINYLTEDTQHFLRDFGYLTSMSITLDGCKELHDSCRLFPDGSPSYDIVEKSVKHAITIGERGTKLTLAPDNIKYIFDGIVNMINLGYIDINLNPVFEDVWTKEDAFEVYNQLIRVADYLHDNNLSDYIYVRMLDLASYTHNTEDISTRRVWCGSCSSMMSVDYSGDIYPCIRFNKISLGDSREPLKLGSVFTGLGTTEKERKNLTLAPTTFAEMEFEDRCKCCNLDAGCGWCAGYCYQKTGELNKKTTYICDIHRMSALASIYYYRISNELTELNKLTITYDDYKDLMSMEEFNRYYFKGGN